MTGTIGIKLANGDFFSILKEYSAEKKRIVLTTVHDNQKSVQIDLYRSVTEAMCDAAYIGSIVMENIAGTPKGEASIEMTVSADTDGIVAVSALDLSNPSNECHLNVCLSSVANSEGAETADEYPDFETGTELDGGTGKQAGISTGKEGKKCPLLELCCQKFPWLMLIVFVLLILLACLGLMFFVQARKTALEPQFFSGYYSGGIVSPQINRLFV